MFAQKTLTALILAAVFASSGCGNHGVMTSPYSVSAPIRTNPSANSAAPRYANRMVVKFKSGATEGQIRSVRTRFRLSSIREVSELGISCLALNAGANASSTIAALQSQPGVAYAEPDFIFSSPTPVHAVHAASVPKRHVAAATNDPELSQQWGMMKIGMAKVWQTNAGRADVIVAVVDTGVDLRHPDLAPNLVPGYNVLPDASGPDDDHGHGTHVSGIIAAAANNGIGVAGVAPHCKIMPVKVLGADGKGDTQNIVAGIVWAANHGAKVINMSLGGTGGSRALMEAIEYAQSKDVLCVAAMGNDGKNSQEYPGGYPGVIAVGATDEQDQIADFSNFGSWISVCAPGQDILSTLPTHPVTVNREEGKELSYDSMDGTSMASPFVAGVAALVRSQFPNLTAAQVKQRIERTADDLGPSGFDDHFGVGRVNAARAALP
jgi:type VII secretion-associated serine protease mycosin